MDKTVSLRDAIYLLLDGTARGLLDPEGEIGCMLNTGMITSHPDNTDLAKELVQRRYEFRCLLRDKLLNRVSIQEAERLSLFITVVMQGLAIQAHDGYTLTELQEAVGVALEAIPADPTII